MLSGRQSQNMTYCARTQQAVPIGVMLFTFLISPPDEGDQGEDECQCCACQETRNKPTAKSSGKQPCEETVLGS